MGRVNVLHADQWNTFVEELVQKDNSKSSNPGWKDYKVRPEKIKPFR
jgi:hypothetical protein